MQGEHVVDAAPREKLGLTPRSRRDQLDLFLRPTTSLGDGELPFSKLRCASVFDASHLCSRGQPRRGSRSPDSPGGIRAVGHEGADEQLVSVASGHVQWRVPKLVSTVNLAA